MLYYVHYIKYMSDTQHKKYIIQNTRHNIGLQYVICNIQHITYNITCWTLLLKYF